MAYLEDKEKRLLFSALSKEKKICEVIDEEEYGKYKLAPIVEGLEKKFYYDRFEKEIRNKAIDEFTEKLITVVESFRAELNGIRADLMTLDYFVEYVWEVAEQMKGDWHYR